MQNKIEDELILATNIRARETPQQLEEPQNRAYRPDNLYRLHTPYKEEGERTPHYLGPIEQEMHPRNTEHLDQKNPYNIGMPEAVRTRPAIPEQYMHMFPYQTVAMTSSALERYEQYKLPPRRQTWVDKEVRLYTYEVPWFATAMTDGETVWLGSRSEIYFAFPDFRVNHEDPGHPMTVVPGWTEDDVDIKGQIYAGVRSSNRVYKV